MVWVVIFCLEGWIWPTTLQATFSEVLLDLPTGFVVPVVHGDSSMDEPIIICVLS